jgi:hypothetical protein
MLRDGSVYFKPSRSVPYTLNCFDNRPDLAETLQKAIAGNPLPFTEGQSVGMLNVLRLLDIAVDEPASSRQEAGQRVKIIPFAIETAFGYWVPFPYQSRLDKKLNAWAERKAAALLQHGHDLTSKRDDDILGAIRERYLKEIDSRLESIRARRLSSPHRRDIETRILGRVHTLQTKLSSKAECQRLARSLDGVPVPEIWEDPRSKNEMIDSFCEYVAWKLSSPTRVPGIVQTLRDWFELESRDEADRIREKIEDFFDSNSLSRSDWGVDALPLEGMRKTK